MTGASLKSDGHDADEPPRVGHFEPTQTALPASDQGQTELLLHLGLKSGSGLNAIGSSRVIFPIRPIVVVVGVRQVVRGIVVLPCFGPAVRLVRENNRLLVGTFGVRGG